MESYVEKIVGEFATNIQRNIISITHTVKTIREKIQILRETYVDLIDKNNHKQILLFCLESFNFQNKTMMYEVDHLQKTLNILLNRTYRDYYKLYNIILKLFEEYNLENKTQKIHPEYRDLDVNAEFSLEDISEIHDDVIYLTCVLIDKYKESEAMIRQYKTKSKTGIYITNLINTIEYDNAILKDQIDLYINYLLFFQDTQTTYLTKLNNKTDIFLREINNDITFQIEDLKVEEVVEDVGKDVVEDLKVEEVVEAVGEAVGEEAIEAVGESVGKEAIESVGKEAIKDAVEDFKADEAIQIEVIEKETTNTVDKRRGRRNIVIKQ